MRRSLLAVVLALATVVAVPLGATAGTRVLGVTPRTVHFGAKPVGSVMSKNVTVTNTSSETISLTIDVIKDWDDFETGVLGTTCTFSEQLLAPGESCVVVVKFTPETAGGFEGVKQDQTLLATAKDPATGELLDSVEIRFIGMAR